jgi:transposase
MTFFIGEEGGMKKMLEYDLVRRLYHHENLSRRAISRRTGYHRRTIDRMLQYSSPPGYQLKNPRPKSKLDPFLPIIDQILKEDKKAPKKQRHTAKRIFDRLKEEHAFSGSYTIVKDYVRAKKLKLKEVYFPLQQSPGTSQTDFGSFQIIIGGVRQKAYLFCMGLPYSDAIFAQAYPTEAFEAVALGHNGAYRFWEGVPPENLYDNMKTAVALVLEGPNRQLTHDFLSLRSHYIFRSRFCNVGRANEKGVVEGLVGYVRRNFLVPILSFPTWEALNDYLWQKCLQRFSHKAAGKEKTIGELLDEERSSFLPFPPTEFDACRQEDRQASSLSLVRYKSNRYSVPVEYAYHKVTVKAYVFEIRVCYRDEVIAIHPRSYNRDDFVFDPLHYLPLLERKPGGLDGAMPFSSWELPECFHTLRRYLEARGGDGGKREYIQVLQLLRDFPLPELRRAIERAFECSCVNFDAVKMILLSMREPSFEAIRLSDERMEGLPNIQVKKPDNALYGALVEGGAL